MIVRWAQRPLGDLPDDQVSDLGILLERLVDSIDAVVQGLQTRPVEVNGPLQEVVEVLEKLHPSSTSKSVL
jgi:hypothetical protein